MKKREPFALIPLSVLSDRRLSGRDLRVYCALSTFSDSLGLSWPSLEAIARRSGGIRAKDIPLHTHKLSQLGYLQITRRGKRLSNTYRLTSNSPVSGESKAASDSPQNGGCDTPLSGDSSIHTQRTSPHASTRTNPDNTVLPQRMGERLTTGKAVEEANSTSEFLTWWRQEFKRRTSSPYVIAWQKDGAIVKRLLADLSLKELMSRARTFFDQKDAWIEEHGHTIPNFAARINQLGSYSKGRSKQEVEFLSLIDVEK